MLNKKNMKHGKLNHFCMVHIKIYTVQIVAWAGFQKPKLKYVKIQKHQSTERVRVHQRLTVNYPEVQSYLPDEAAAIIGAFHGL